MSRPMRHAIPVPRTTHDDVTLDGLPAQIARVHIDWHVVGDTEQVWVRTSWDPKPIFHRIHHWTPDSGDAWLRTLCGQDRYWPCTDAPCRAALEQGGTPCGHVGGPRGLTVPYRFLNGRIIRPCRRCFTPARAVDPVTGRPA